MQPTLRLLWLSTSTLRIVLAPAKMTSPATQCDVRAERGQTRNKERKELLLGSKNVMSSESLPPNMKVLEAFSVTEGRLDRSEIRGGFSLENRGGLKAMTSPVVRAGRMEREARASRAGTVEEQDRRGTPEYDTCTHAARHTSYLTRNVTVHN